MASKAEQARATRERLVGVAREQFAIHGYAGASIEEIVRGAGLTRGALYHHFPDKRALFAAAHEAVERERFAGVWERAGDEPPERRLEAGVSGYLDACLDPAARRIVLLDGPAVLGAPDGAGGGLAPLAEALERAMAGGFVERQPVGPLAHLVFGALNEAGLAIARAEDPVRARRELGYSLIRLLDGLAPLD